VHAPATAGPLAHRPCQHGVQPARLTPPGLLLSSPWERGTCPPIPRATCRPRRELAGTTTVPRQHPRVVSPLGVPASHAARGHPAPVPHAARALRPARRPRAVWQHALRRVAPAGGPAHSNARTVRRAAPDPATVRAGHRCAYQGQASPSLPPALRRLHGRAAVRVSPGGSLRISSPSSLHSHEPKGGCRSKPGVWTRSGGALGGGER
jgi:hypothetical protein